MKKLFSKTVISFALMLFMSLFCTSAFANERMQTLQVTAYVGPVVNLSACDAGGLHSATDSTDDIIDASVHGMELDQDLLWGINGRYYFDSYGIDVGIDLDLSFSFIKFPSQSDISVEGSPVIMLPQPEAEYDIVSFAIGPIFRYQGSGIFDNFNPYLSPSVSVHYGKASNVNLYPGTYPIYPQYGQFGTSTITGIGYGIKLGGEYFLNEHFGFLIEFRYTKNNYTIDHFRSFKYGMDMATHTSSIIIGTTWSF